MTRDDAEIAWVADHLPDVPDADPAATERVRAELLAHLSAASPEPAPQPARPAVPGGNAREHRRRHRLGAPRRRAAVLGLAAGIAAAVVIAVNLTGGGGRTPGSGAVASAATIRSRALNVLVPGPGGILEGDVTEYQTNVRGVRTESQGYAFWSMTSRPWAFRLLQTGFNGDDAESAITSAGRQQLYDRATNTVEVLAPRLRLAPGPRPGTRRLTVPAYQLQTDGGSPKGVRLPAADRHVTTTITITDAQAHDLALAFTSIVYGKLVHFDRRQQTAILTHPTVQRGGGPPGNIATQFTQPILKLLHGRDSTVDRHATLDGRPAISITQVAGPVTATMRRDGYTARTEYWIEPGSYRPLLEVVTSLQDPDANGHLVASTSTTRFPRWRTLTGPAASPTLLSIAAQHPGTRTVDVGVSAYAALSNRLYPTK